MVGQKLSVFDRIIECIENKQNFVLQGGAGSGKTETLKKVLEYFCQTYPDKKVACITYTNLAVDEIKSRVKEGDITVSTIHSFLNGLIGDYKKNIHQVIHEVYYLDKVDIAKRDSQKYSKKCDQYYSRFFKITGVKSLSEFGGKDYKLNYIKYHQELNDKIEELNEKIRELVKTKNYNEIHYSDTTFSRIDDLSFSHDDLLKIVALLCKKYPKLPQIIQDKYDLIFIDEYQDTTSEIIDIFLKQLPNQGKTIIGLFGDSMQSIYDKGIGEVENYIKNGDLIRIQKEDNFRCSSEVRDLITKLRNDGLSQNIALKKDETITDREGKVICYYGIYNGRNREAAIKHLMNQALQKEKSEDKYTKLMLTKKSIAQELGFSILYKIFKSRYKGQELSSEIEERLIQLQLIKLCQLCHAYQNKKYNYILTEVKKYGFSFNKLTDKNEINRLFDILLGSDISMSQCLEKAFKNKIIDTKKHLKYKNRRKEFLNRLSNDEVYQNFKNIYTNGAHTFFKFNKIQSIDKVDFKRFERGILKENFYIQLFSEQLLFKEILNFYTYYIDESEYTTMHKTKGTGIENVLLVIEDFGWNSKYAMNGYFDPNPLKPIREERLSNSQRIMYVAASRAKKNLICVKLVRNEEEEDVIKAFFENTEKIDLVSIGSN